MRQRLVGGPVVTGRPAPRLAMLGDEGVATEYELETPMTGAAREILGCLLVYSVATGLLGGEGLVRVCVRPYHHEGACRVGARVYVYRDHATKLWE